MRSSAVRPSAVAEVNTFSPVVRRSVADEVRRQLEGSIHGGVLQPGDALSNEESMCTQFNVSRQSVREALRDLVTLGLVERRGKRVFVVEQLPSVRIDADDRTARVRDIFETRRLIEVEVTQLAAARATKRQRDAVAELAASIALATDVEQLRPLDRAFHGVIAAAAGNALLAELHTKVLDAVFSTPPFEAVLRGAESDDEASRILAESAAMHATIAAAVVAGDVTAAGSAARAHLDDVERRIIGGQR